MGDEGISDPTPLKKARTGDLKRVAEIVMVLSAMGEMRAGKDPTAAEKALAAEARERLTGICERQLRPKDLISREAVRVVVEDLGLNRSRDPMMGFRPSKMSIADKLLLTKRKMEESKAFASPSSVHSSQHPMGESHASMMHGTPKFIPDRQNPMAFSAGGFQTVSPGVHVLGPNSVTSSLKQLHAGDTQHAATPSKSSAGPSEKDSPLTAPQTGTPHLRFDGRFSGPHYSTPVQATSAEKTTATSSVQPSPAAFVKGGQPNNLLDHTQGKSNCAHAINNVQTSDQVVKASAVHGSVANLPIGHQPAQGAILVTGPSFFTVHEEISKCVQKVLQPRVFDHPNWNPPSAEYTNKPISCQICKVNITDVEGLLVCDACEKGTHLKCLQSYGNKDGISKAEWHCPRCLITSNGKPFPPKYGRVTRTIAPQKAPLNTVANSVSSEKRPENLATKVNQQKPVVNGNSGVPPHVHASSSATSCSEITRDSSSTTAVDIKSGIKEGISPILKKEDGSSSIKTEDMPSSIKEEEKSCPVTSSNNSTEQTAVVCRTPCIAAKSSDKKVNESLASNTERSAPEPMLDQVESEKLCSEKALNTVVETAGQSQMVCTNAGTERSDNDMQIDRPSRSNVEKLTSEAMLDQVESEKSYPDPENPQNIVVETADPPYALGESRETGVPISVEVSTGQRESINPSTDVCIQPSKLQEESQFNSGCDARSDEKYHCQAASVEKPNDDESKPFEVKETSEREANNNVLDSQDNNDIILNGAVDNDGSRVYERPPVRESDAVHWLGDVLQVVNEKTYYQSCQVNGVFHKLEDHVLISSNHRTSLPSKLQSLWEDNITGSKWATVNQYYSPTDLPEGSNHPAPTEDNEVYASNTETTVPARSICGVCEVLSVQKFKEEADRRTHTRDANKSLHPVYLCRWVYDKSKGIFQSINY